MKSLISILVLTLSVLFLSAQQNDTFKISYKFSIPDSILDIDIENETDSVKKELATIALMAKMFQEEGKPVAQAWVNNEFIRINQNILNDSYQLTNKKTETSFNISPFDKQYAATTPASDKLILIGDDYLLVSELPIEFVDNVTKDILGYSCKLARIVAKAAQGVSVDIWYAEELPKLYWGEYAYLKKIPGAALHITTMGIGIEASEIVKDNDNTIFEIPENYELREATDYTEASKEHYPYEVAENRYAYFDTNNGFYGLMDTAENIIIEPSFTLISTFYNGQAIVANEAFQYGTIDLNGQPVLPLEYISLDYDQESNLYLFCKDELYGIMDQNGDILIPNRYQGLSFFQDGYAIFYKDGLEGLIDKSEKVIVPATHKSIFRILKDQLISFEDSTYSCYDLKTNKKLFGGYHFLDSSGEENLLIAAKNQKFGFIDLQGNEVIPLKYAYVSNFHNGIASVMDNEQNEYFINTKGEKIEN